MLLITIEKNCANREEDKSGESNIMKEFDTTKKT